MWLPYLKNSIEMNANTITAILASLVFICCQNIHLHVANNQEKRASQYQRGMHSLRSCGPCRVPCATRELHCILTCCMSIWSHSSQQHVDLPSTSSLSESSIGEQIKYFMRFMLPVFLLPYS